MQKGSINRVILVGHLGSDPETRYTTTGNAVATFNLATNETWKNSEGNLEDKTEWHRCVLFGKLAESAKDVLTKGQLIYLEGRLRTRQWEDKDNVRRYTTEIVGEMFTMLGGRKQSSETATGDAQNGGNGDDLPF
ncbi:MAG: single-stranded DNA-binding protein [Candidatus Neomarinimicrobiota bacterium]|nr:MAG: single-stranded DNA-binding protein [Candidatus Neomarinimicrobiota bacterium]